MLENFNPQNNLVIWYACVSTVCNIAHASLLNNNYTL